MWRLTLKRAESSAWTAARYNTVFLASMSVLFWIFAEWIVSIFSTEPDVARNAAPDAQIVSQETRRVNGRDVMVLQIRGTLQAIRFVYLGYYYAGPEGTIQLLTYTAANLFDEYKPQFEQLLDGLTINQ